MGKGFKVILGLVLIVVFIKSCVDDRLPPNISWGLCEILKAEKIYFADHDVYIPLEVLKERESPFIGSGWVGEVKDGFRFTIRVGVDGKSFMAYCEDEKPSKKPTERFYVDNTGVFRFTTDGSEPNAGSTKLKNLRQFEVR